MPPTTLACSICGQPAITICARCRREFYCCEEHKLVHWPTHRHDCEPVRKPQLPPCLVCGETSTVECLNCRRVFYCGDEHRANDLLRHRVNCSPCEVFLSPESGYCLRATRDISLGETILTETPFILGPAHFAELPCCVGCFSHLPSEVNTLPKCPKCQWVVCSLNCPGLADPDGHEYECPVLELVEDKKSSWLLPIRCMLLQKTNPGQWQWLLERTSRALPRQTYRLKNHSVASALEYMAYTIFQKKPCYLPMDYSAGTLNRIYAFLDAYGLYFYISGGESECTGLYKSAGFLQVICGGNVRTEFCVSPQEAPRMPLGKVSLLAATNIRSGETLSSPYAPSVASTFNRQRILAYRNMVCQCPRCLDPRELGFDSGTMKCTSCPGWIVPLERDVASCNWACGDCGETKTATAILERVYYFARLHRTVSKPPGLTRLTPVILEEMIDDYLAELHPRHETALLFKLFMAKVYGTAKLNAGVRNLSDQHLERKAVLCNEVLDALFRFGPIYHGVETHIVFAIKEFAETQFEITQRKFSSAIWTSDEATGNLVKCVNLLQPVVKLFGIARLEDPVMYSRLRETYVNILRYALIHNLIIDKNVDSLRLLQAV